MREFFRDQMHEERARRGHAGVVGLWIRALPDLVVAAAHERVAAFRVR
jgi:hypothetical protein